MIIKSATVIAGPSYEYKMEDGIGTTWDLLVVATCHDGSTYTHQRSFDMKHEVNTAQDLCDAVTARGSINTAHWVSGSPWDKYTKPQTYEEEKAQALAWEADNPAPTLIAHLLNR